MIRREKSESIAVCGGSMAAGCRKLSVAES